MTVSKFSWNPGDAAGIDWDDDDDEITEARGAKRGDDTLKHYWTKDPEGLAKWVDHEHPWTALHAHIIKHVAEPLASQITSSWYHEVFGHWPAEKQGKS